MKIEKLFVFIFILFSIITSVSCCSCRKPVNKEYCKTKYPVLLVHGVAFRDKTVVLKYWGDLPCMLKKNGADVYTGGQDAYGTIADNSEQLKKAINSILDKTGKEKINIIAHSRGGIESRYMISRLGMQDKVVSLTTVATPHRGSAMADIIMKKLDEKSFAADIINFYADIIGDNTPASYNAGVELTRESMKEFNKKVPDMKEVYYQSYAGAIDDSFKQGIWRQMYRIMKKHEGENDGLVSVDSAKWGVFRGIADCNGKAKVSHSDIIGMHFLSEEYCFDEIEFYINIVHELKEKGY